MMLSMGIKWEVRVALLSSATHAQQLEAYALAEKCNTKVIMPKFNNRITLIQVHGG